MTIKNYTIEEYANSDIQSSPSSSISIGTDITKSQPQGDAWRVEYISIIQGRQSSFTILVLVKNGQTGNLYKLDFSSAVLDAPEQLPVANKIIESFRFI